MTARLVHLSEPEGMQKPGRPTRLDLWVPFWPTSDANAVSKTIELRVYECDYKEYKDQFEGSWTKAKAPASETQLLATFKVKLARQLIPSWYDWSVESGEIKDGRRWKKSSKLPASGADLEIVIGKQKFPIRFPEKARRADGAFLEIGWGARDIGEAKDSIEVTDLRYVVSVYDASYYLMAAGLHLKRGSIDQTGTRNPSKITAPRKYVRELQEDLIELGYLLKKIKHKKYPSGNFDWNTERALWRFQRHAGRKQRMDKKGVKQEVAPVDIVNGGSDRRHPAHGTVCDRATARQIYAWKQKGWVVPVGYFKLKGILDLWRERHPGDTDNKGWHTHKHARKNETIHAPRLREDAARHWVAFAEDVYALGGTLDGPYDGTPRRASFKAKKDGAKANSTSKMSLHFLGLAVDIRQNSRVYKQVSEKGKSAWREATSRDYWRLYGTTTKTRDEVGDKALWDEYVVRLEGASRPKVHNLGHTIGAGMRPGSQIPAGDYIDLPKLARKHKFMRIPARKNWNSLDWENLKKPAGKEAFKDADTAWKRKFKKHNPDDWEAKWERDWEDEWAKAWREKWKARYNQTEWWHFSFKLPPATFLDEAEMLDPSARFKGLVYNEEQLRKWGWGSAEQISRQHLDGKPR